MRKEAMDDGRLEGERDGMLRAFSGLVRDGVITLAEAASRVGLTAEEFAAEAEAL